MKKTLILIAVSMFFAGFFTIAQAVEQWTPTVSGGENAADLDIILSRNNNATDRVMAGFRENVELSYASASTLTISAGEIVCSNAAGTDREFRRNTAAVTAAWTDIDTGAEASATTYYCYGNCDANATTFTATLSTSSSAPTGVTNYRRLGSFYNDASGNIVDIANDDYPLRTYDSGWFAVAASTSYSKTHNLGTQQISADLYFSASSDGSNAVKVIYSYDDLIGQHGGSIHAITATTLTVSTADDAVVIYADGSSYTSATSGYYRVVAEALE